MKLKEKNYWFWVEHGNISELPGMDPVTALAFQMTESYLAPIIPLETYNLLKPYVNRAKEVLNSTSSPLKNWSQKIVVINRGPSLIKPHLKPEIQHQVYQSLLREKQLKVYYKPRCTKELTEYIVNPLGLAIKQDIIYLVCTFWKYKDIMQLALHRIQSVELLQETAIFLDDFDLSTYAQDEHQFSYPISAEPIQLKALFTAYAAEHLYETPLMDDQILSIQADNRILLEGSIIETLELRWWLSGFGSNVEIIEPQPLKEFFTKEAKKMMSYYQKPLTK